MYWKFEIETCDEKYGELGIINHNSYVIEQEGEIFKWHDITLFSGRVMLSFGRSIGIVPLYLSERMRPWNEWTEQNVTDMADKVLGIPSSRVVTADEILRVQETYAAIRDLQKQAREADDGALDGNCL